MLHHILIGSLPSLRLHESLASGGLEDGASPLDCVGDRRGGEFFELLIDQALITSVHPDNLHVIEYGRSGDGPYACVHPRRIPTGSKNGDFLYLSHIDEI